MLYNVQAAAENPEETSKQSIPSLYRNMNTVTLALFGFGFVFMFVDTIRIHTGLPVSVYIVWCLCCLSLFFTNKIALAEWKANNEREEKASEK